MTLTVIAGFIPARLPRPLAGSQQPSRLRCVIAAGVIALGAMITLAPVANAGTPEANCADAGGKLYTNVQGGHTFQTCCYKDAEGKTGCDNYQDGVYKDTTAFRPHGPVTGPSSPPANNAPIPTTPRPAK